MSKKTKKAVYWIRMEVPGQNLRAGYAAARKAMMEAYRTPGIASACMVSESDLMRLIKTGIAEAFSEDGETDDIGPQAGQAPGQVLDCGSRTDVPSARRGVHAKRQAEEEDDEQ